MGEQHAPREYERTRIFILAMVRVLGLDILSAAANAARSGTNLSLSCRVVRLGAQPHIAISSAGQVGSPEGILTRLRKELESGHVNLQADPLDTEYFEVKQKILEKVSYGRKLPSLAMLTDIASDLVADNVAALIRDCVKLETTDVAVLTGVQVYGPEAKDWVYTKSFYSIVNGEKQVGYWPMATDLRCGAHTHRGAAILCAIQDHTEDLKQLAKQAHVIAEDDPPVVGG